MPPVPALWRKHESWTILTILGVSLIAIGAFPASKSQQAAPGDTSLLGEMRWRMPGPHRASRSKAISGIPEQPHTFYMGVVNGGVWKTTDAGRTWTPIFDDQPTGSIGSIAIAPSSPSVIDVGTGEGQQRPGRRHHQRRSGGPAA